MRDEVLDQKPIFEAEGVELLSGCEAFHGVHFRDYSWSDIAHLHNVESVLFTRISIQAPYLCTKKNGVRTLSSGLLVLKFVCQARAWIREIRDDPYRGSLFEAWGLDHNPELDSIFNDLGINPCSSQTSPVLFEKAGLRWHDGR
jgi:hypothetical protein